MFFAYSFCESFCRHLGRILHNACPSRISLGTSRLMYLWRLKSWRSFTYLQNRWTLDLLFNVWIWKCLISHFCCRCPLNCRSQSRKLWHVWQLWWGPAKHVLLSRAVVGTTGGGALLLELWWGSAGNAACSNQHCRNLAVREGCKKKALLVGFRGFFSSIFGKKFPTQKWVNRKKPRFCDKSV